MLRAPVVTIMGHGHENFVRRARSSNVVSKNTEELLKYWAYQVEQK